MSRGVEWSLFGAAVGVALIALAGCSHYWLAEREPWRHEAEVACLNSGALREAPGRVRINAITGPGICGADYPLRVSMLGDSAPLGYDDEPLRPPSNIPESALPRHWPLIESRTLPPPAGSPRYGMPQYETPPQHGTQQVAPLQTQPPPLQAAAPSGRPLSINPPGVPGPEDDAQFTARSQAPYYGAPSPSPPPAPPPRDYSAPTYQSPAYPPRAEPAPPPADQQVPLLGPPRAPMVSAPVGPVEVRPAATLACPIVSALDQWIATAVQPAALRWFRQPVVEIKQISAYSCRGMNGNPSARISEHAFGNALDIAEFALADGRRISVQYGWRGAPEEQGFLRDVQAAACAQFTTVLAPGANIYHYNHIHVDLMRRVSRRHICEPPAIPGEVVAERARARYAAQREANVTGTIRSPQRWRVLGYSGEEGDKLPLAVPGED